MSPKRIQLSRKKGWRKPEGTIVVARPSRWGNPFKVGDIVTHPHYRDLAGLGPINPKTAVTLFEAWSYHRHVLDDHDGSIRYGRLARQKLAGHDLACWCPLDQPCHADVLLSYANDPTWEDET